MKPRLIVVVVLLTLVVLFAIQNTSAVQIRLLFWQITMSRALLIFLTLAVGIVIGWFFRTMYRLSRIER